MTGRYVTRLESPLSCVCCSRARRRMTAESNCKGGSSRRRRERLHSTSYQGLGLNPPDVIIGGIVGLLTGTGAQTLECQVLSQNEQRDAVFVMEYNFGGRYLGQVVSNFHTKYAIATNRVSKAQTNSSSKETEPRLAAEIAPRYHRCSSLPLPWRLHDLAPV
jgi:hypothetical protein